LYVLLLLLGILHYSLHSLLLMPSVRRLAGQKIDLPVLPIAKGAGFNSYENQHDPRCHPETRVKLLRQITAWADDPQGECIFWLNGMAGTGKSTISRTVAQLFDERKELGASFFFKRGEGDRGHAALLINLSTSCLAWHHMSEVP
jgi:hypothetical protein